MTEQNHVQATQTAFSGPGIMLLSAAIFAYFGFGITWIHTSAATGQTLLFVVLLDWTLKATAIAFAASAALAFANRMAGNLLYSLAGLISAAMFIVVAIMDYADKQHTAISPLILLIFAAWNGYGAWQGLRQMMSAPHVESLI